MSWLPVPFSAKASVEGEVFYDIEVDVELVVVAAFVTSRWDVLVVAQVLLLVRVRNRQQYLIGDFAWVGAPRPQIVGACAVLAA